MKDQYFEHISFFDFFKSEFRSMNLIQKIAAFISLFFFIFINYSNKKSWIELYHSINYKLLHFYPEVSCKSYGNSPSLVSFVMNQGETRMVFEFNKCHIGISSASIYFFPYRSDPIESLGYNVLEEPFRIVYNPKEKKDRYSTVHTISSLKLIKEIDRQTHLIFQLKGVNEETVLILNKKLNINT